ncbi:MAG: hypothetical protein RR382_11135, partial [Tannerellaceae bacterium]
ILRSQSRIWTLKSKAPKIDIIVIVIVEMVEFKGESNAHNREIRVGAIKKKNTSDFFILLLLKL